jgi:hypothetical protein
MQHVRLSETEVELIISTIEYKQETNLDMLKGLHVENSEHLIRMYRKYEKIISKLKVMEGMAAPTEESAEEEEGQQENEDRQVKA